jgi:hypothetical protein
MSQIFVLPDELPADIPTGDSVRMSGMLRQIRALASRRRLGESAPRACPPGMPATTHLRPPVSVSPTTCYHGAPTRDPMLRLPALSRSELRDALVGGFKLKELEQLTEGLDPKLYTGVDWRGSLTQIADSLADLAIRAGLGREVLWFAWLERPHNSTLARLMARFYSARFGPEELRRIFKATPTHLSTDDLDTCLREALPPTVRPGLVESGDARCYLYRVLHLLEQLQADSSGGHPMYAFIRTLRRRCPECTELTSVLAALVNDLPPLTRERYLTAAPDPMTAGIQRLVLKIAPVTLNHYTVTAWLVDAGGRAARIELPAPYSAEDAPVSREDLCPLLGKLVEPNRIRRLLARRELQIELIVPRSLMCEPFHAVKQQFQQDQCLYLGHHAPIILRSLERMYDKDDLARALLHDRWSKLHTLTGKPDPHIAWESARYDPKDIYNRLFPIDVLCCSVLEPIGASPSAFDPLVNGISTGLPVMLWTLDGSYKSQQMQDEIAAELDDAPALRSLPSRIRGWRADRSLRGLHVALLWDDPNAFPAPAREPNENDP